MLKSRVLKTSSVLLLGYMQHVVAVSSNVRAMLVNQP
jgi:hypothetical protein